MSSALSRFRLLGVFFLLMLAVLSTNLLSHSTNAQRADESTNSADLIGLEGTEIIEASPVVNSQSGVMGSPGLFLKRQLSSDLFDLSHSLQRKGEVLQKVKADKLPNAPQLIFNGSIAAGDLTQTGRLTTGSISNCTGSNTCPGPVDSTARRYDAYAIRNISANTECVTVQLNATGCGGTFMAASAYLTFYNPASLCTNFLGVTNATFNGTQSFSFNVPGNSSFVIVVYEASPNTGCPDYTLTVSSTNIASCPADIITGGSITASDSTQVGRLLTGAISNCSTAATCPGPVNSLPRHFDQYRYVNTSSTAECVTVELNASGCGGQFMASASYLDNFDPANLCANYLASTNATFNGTQSYAYIVPAGATFDVAVYEASPDTFCPSYTLKVKSCANLISPPPVGALLISEFRLRGPNGANDEFIEIYNGSGADHTVASVSGTGYGIAASDGVTRCVIPNGTVIPNRGHYLCANSIGYSLASYPAGNGVTATADATYVTDIPDNAGIALFNNSSGGAAYSIGNRIDAVGSSTEANTIYREGTGYPALLVTSINYSFYRDNCGKSGSISSAAPCTSGGLLVDANNNATDFILVDPTALLTPAGQRLGSPGPENLSGPIQRNATMKASLTDPCVASSAAPNRVRDTTADPGNNSTFGTLDIRRAFRNNTGGFITRLRFRIVDITTFPAPAGIADLRLRTSTAAVVTVDRPPCGTGTSNIVIQGTTLEQPPNQTIGGGFNGTLSAGTITLGTPLANGASIDVRFLLGVQQSGTFRFFINVEALP
jgi:hypothetical protein